MENWKRFALIIVVLFCMIAFATLVCQVGSVSRSCNNVETIQPKQCPECIKQKYERMGK